MSGSAFNCTNKVFRMSKSVQFFFLQKWFFVPNLARKVWLTSVRPLEYAIMSEIQSYSCYHRPIFVILLSYPTYLKWLSLSCLSLNNKIFRMSEKIERVADNMNTTVSLTSISVRNNLLPRFSPFFIHLYFHSKWKMYFDDVNSCWEHETCLRDGVFHDKCSIYPSYSVLFQK